MITATTSCTCEHDGHCERYGKEMNGRLRSICRGDDIDERLAEQYRQLWLDQKNGVPIHEAKPACTDCPHRGPESRDAEDKVKTRDCQSCCGRVRLKLFPCRHPAREPEEVTLADCRECRWRPQEHPEARSLILKNHLSPGDVLAMTAAVYSLHKQHPGRFVTAIDSTCPAVWEHNPDVVSVEEALAHRAEVVQTHYPAINQSNQRAIHFMQAYCEFLEDALQVRVPLLTNRPMLYVSNREKTWLPQVWEKTGKEEHYWVINAGRKHDYTAKFWGTDAFQRVVDLLRGKVQFVQIGENAHHHPHLRGVMDLVGSTDTRQLVRLCYHADGGLGGVTFLQHLMAGLEKPYVCVMGGREPVLWNSYPRETLLHTIGSLLCCREGGCWKSRVVPLGDGDEKDGSLCENPRWGDSDTPQWGEEAVPLCMHKITPDQVAEAVLKYLPG